MKKDDLMVSQWDRAWIEGSRGLSCPKKSH